MGSAARFRRLAETLIVLTLASLVIRFLPFRTVIRLAARVPQLTSDRRARNDRLVAQIRGSLEAWARRVPWRTVCFQLGLALHVMLRLRGIPSVLHYGVRQTVEQGLQAHVWVTLGEEAVIGGEEAIGYACLASVPSADA
jgi:Na+/H+ antiporter NhaD/arsenite permease-like protein